MKTQRAKGKKFELWVAAQIRERLGVPAKRGLQARDGSDAPDVILDGWWIECKHGRKPNWRGALAQARAACENPMEAVVICKDNRETPVVIMDFDAWLSILGGEPKRHA